MSDESSPSFAANAAEYGAEGLSTDAIETILADFRAWLAEARETPLPETRESFDVATVLQHFVALRQEINLQTKSNRAQLEQSSQTMAMLQEALGAIERQQTQNEENDQTVQDEIVRPLLKTLVDTYDALEIAERQVRKLMNNPPPANAGGSPPTANAPPVIKLKLPHWARWLGLDASIEAQLAPLYEWHKASPVPSVPGESSDRYRHSIEALLAGYRMSLQRIDRAFESYSLETFPCVGETFDPELMEVAEVVRDENCTKIEVIEQLRRGYLWRGRLFRCAQVRVAKNP